MSSIILYHNPQCTTSKKVLNILEQQSFSFTVIDYIKNPLDISQLQILLSQLNIDPIHLIRKTSIIYKKFKNTNYSINDILSELSTHPLYIERPILLKDNVGIIVRPYNKIYDFLNISY